MTDDLEPISGDFQLASREAWLDLVDKVLKGGSFARLVSKSADGLTIDPLTTRAATDALACPVGRPPAAGHRWDIRQRHAEPDPKLSNAAILDDLEGGVTSLILQIEAPGQSGLGYGAEPLAAALKGVALKACTIALDGRENTMDVAGSLLEIWRENDIDEGQRHAAFNYDPLGVLAKTGTLYYPADRACAIAAKFAADARAMPKVKALVADGRPYHEAGASEAQELAAMLATLVAYLRACESEGFDAPAPSTQPRRGGGRAATSGKSKGQLALPTARQLVLQAGEACEQRIHARGLA